MPENNRGKSPGWGMRWGNSCAQKRGLMVDAWASVQILVPKIGGGQSEIFTVSRRVDPTGQGDPSS